MRKKAIGIDISGVSVKVVELAYSGKGIEIVSFHSERLEEGRFSEELAAVLRKKIADGTKVVSSVPARSAILRSTVVPFRDEKKISRIVRFEAERYLPFPVEEAVVDFYIIEPVEKGKRIMLVSVRREFVEKHLSFLKGFGIEPEIVDLDSMALLNLLSGEKGNFALVDIGSDTTSISVVSGGIPRLLRSIPKGGDSLTEACPEVSGEALASISDGIIYTISAFSLQKTDFQVEKIVLSGGGAKSKDLSGFLKEKSGLDIVRIDSLRDISHNLDEEDVRGSGDVAIGLALRGLKRRDTTGTTVNFKKSLVETSGGRKSFPGLIVLASMIVLLSFSLVSLRFYRRRVYLANLEKQIESVVEEAFPGESLGGRSSLEIVSVFRRRIKESREGTSPSVMFSPLGILRALSLSIPSSTGVEITDMRLEGDFTQLEGETGSFEELEKLVKDISSSDYFMDVRIGRADSVHGKVKFRLDIHSAPVRGSRIHTNEG